MLQACHELVPPDALAPVLRQLVDSFVHDRARPEVMTLGPELQTYTSTPSCQAILASHC